MTLVWLLHWEQRMAEILLCKDVPFSSETNIAAVIVFDVSD